jgi:DNA-directed RNA polymerase subunit RPC12/RpoP
MPAIKVKCPHCGAVAKAPETSDGKIVSCPACAKKFQVRSYDELEEGNGEPGTRIETRSSRRGRDRDEDDEEERSVRRGRDDDQDDEDDRPRRSRRSEREDDDDRDERPSRGGYRCPYCGTRRPPIVRQQVSQTGWIVFVLLLIFTVCLFWIGLLIKEDVRVCSECGMKLP